MTVFLCVDDNMGMMFNNRRVSRDSEVVKKIIEMSGTGVVYMNEYSKKLFEDGFLNKIKVLDDFLEQADITDNCFVETCDISEYKEKIDKIVLFKWNRVYPSDKKLHFDFSFFELKDTFEFEGTSHDKITCEVWEHENK